MPWYNWKRNVVRNTSAQARWKRLGNEMSSAQKRLKYTKYDHRGVPKRYQNKAYGNRYRLDQTISNSASAAVNNIGRSYSVTNSKTSVQLSENGFVDTDSLYEAGLTVIERNVTGNEINNRERDTILLKGIRVDAQFRNDTALPLYVRCAIVHRKNGSTVGTNDFFRSYGVNRANDFNSGGTAGSLRLRSDPINTDEYDVLKTWSYTLHPRVSGTITNYNEVAPNWVDVSEYVSINRYVRYEGAAGLTCTEKLYFVFWGAQAGSNSTVAPVVNGFKRQLRLVTFFKDT